jgi:two-component system sensor histidine kinase KdpD
MAFLLFPAELSIAYARFKVYRLFPSAWQASRLIIPRRRSMAVSAANPEDSVSILSNRRRWRVLPNLRRVNPYLGSFFVAVVYLAVALALPEQTSRWSASAILLMAVLSCASLWGLRFGLLVSVFTALAYDFFFIPPIYSLDIELWPNALAVFIFGLAAAAVSTLAEILNRRTLAARRDEILAKRLYALSQRLSDADDTQAIARSVIASVGVAVGARAAFLVEENGRLKLLAAHPATPLPTQEEIDALTPENGLAVRKIGEPADEKGASFTRVPMDPMSGASAIMMVQETSRRFWHLRDRLRVIDALATQGSAAFRRVMLMKRAEEAQILAETERLRSALLTSISHDLKTPLAVILGSASSLHELGPSLDDADAQDLLRSILEEGKRLNQFIVNLLDMSRIESDAIKPKRHSTDLGDVIGSALQRAGGTLSNHEIALEIPATLPSVEVDPVLMEKALFSVLENAAIYTPAGTTVAVTAFDRGDAVAIRISDEGPGLAPGDLPHLFEKFFRGRSGSWKPTGTGLGLAISKGFLEVMGGTITAANREDRNGAVFTIEVPTAISSVHRELSLD